MPINVTCDHCGQSLQVLEEHSGKQVRCPKCYQVFVAKTGPAAAPVVSGGAESVPVSVSSPATGGPAGSFPAPAGAPVAAKFCANCGATLPLPGAAFCPSCGGAQGGGSGGAGTPQQGGFVAPSFAPQGAGAYPAPYGQSQTACGMATAALVLGIISFMCFGPLASIPAVICGHVARNQIRNSNGTLSGEGMAMTGLVLGYINIVLMCLMFSGHMAAFSRMGHI